MARSLFHDAFAHHVWASKQILDACAELSAEQLARPAPGTYGPIIDTLRHMVQSDTWYLRLFSDRPVITEDAAAAMKLKRLVSEAATSGVAWMEVIENEPDGEREVVERDNGWEMHSPVGLQFAQAVHHGTDHRSQVCTALTSMGVEPPQLDLWAYARATGRERAVPPDVQTDGN